MSAAPTHLSAYGDPETDQHCRLLPSALLLAQRSEGLNSTRKDALAPPATGKTGNLSAGVNAIMGCVSSDALERESPAALGAIRPYLRIRANAAPQAMIKRCFEVASRCLLRTSKKRKRHWPLSPARASDIIIRLSSTEANRGRPHPNLTYVNVIVADARLGTSTHLAMLRNSWAQLLSPSKKSSGAMVLMALRSPRRSGKRVDIRQPSLLRLRPGRREGRRNRLRGLPSRGWSRQQHPPENAEPNRSPTGVRSRPNRKRWGTR